MSEIGHVPNLRRDPPARPRPDVGLHTACKPCVHAGTGCVEVRVDHGLPGGGAWSRVGGVGVARSRALAALCATEIVSWGVLYYAFPVLVGTISADTGWSVGAARGPSAPWSRPAPGSSSAG